MAKTTVYLVDDDEGIRTFISALLQLHGYKVKLYASGKELLAEIDKTTFGCLIVDFRMPEMSGLQLIHEVRNLGAAIPFVLLSGCATISMAVEAMKLGAVTIIEKPFDPPELLKAVQETLAESERIHDAFKIKESQTDFCQLLTPREREILRLVVSGCMTKNIARTLGISTKTVEVHRSNITKKFRVDSVAQLIGRVLTIDPHFLSDDRESQRTTGVRT